MNKRNKFYKKAMNYYCDGKLGKAALFCDKVLELERGHSPSLNLRGLIYYIQGNLQQAVYFWKLSYKLNGDMVSKKYLEDSKKDEADLYIFNQGVLLLNEYKVREALNCFIKCEGSNFNSLSLWGYIAKCYMQLGEYKKSIRYVNQILELDINNVEALLLKGQLKELGVYEKSNREIKNIKIMASIPIALLIGFVVVFGSFKGYHLIKNWVEGRQVSSSGKVGNNGGENTNNDNFLGNSDENKNNKTENPEDNEEIESEITSFNGATLSTFISTKNFEEMIKYLDNFNEEKLSTNEKSIVNEAKKLIVDEGIEKIYEAAMDSMKNEKYKEAIDKLKLAYKYSSTSYLNEHILFMLAASYEKEKNIEVSNEYFELYAKDYLKTGSYIQQCLYSLAVNNKDIDNEKSKKYAELLISNYEDSEYNNTIIKDILN